MPASPLPNVKVKFWNRTGQPLAGGKVYTYVAGSVNTSKTTWKDYNKVTANSNPVILDAYGEADIWLDGNYKINLTDSADVNQWSAPIDNVSSISQLNTVLTSTGSSNAYVLTPSPAITSYTGGIFTFIPNFTNTGPATINISGLGAIALKKYGSNALVSGDVVSGTIVTIYYDGTNFQVANPAIFPSGSAALPSVAVGNATTGLYSSSANVLNIATNGVSRASIGSTGDWTIGSAGVNGLRYFDIVNRDVTSGSSGVITRLITKNVAGSGDAVSEIVKYKNGNWLFNNSETDTAASYLYTMGCFAGVNFLSYQYANSGTVDHRVAGVTSVNGENCVASTMYGKDSAGNLQAYAKYSAKIVDNTNGLEDGSIVLQASKAGTLTDTLEAGFNSSGQNVFKIQGTDIWTSGEKVIAQCRFNASSGTPTIVDSYNVSSITDNGVGDFTINLTTGIATATKMHAQISVGLQNFMPQGFISTITTSSVRVLTRIWTSGTAEAQADLVNDVFVTIYGKVY